MNKCGIFVLKSKNYSGCIFGGVENAQWTQCLPNKEKNIFFSQRCELKDIHVSSSNCIILKRPDMLKQMKKDIKERNIVYTVQEININ